MQNVIRFTLSLFLIVSMSAAAWAKTDPKPAEYKRVDTNYYWKGDVLKVEPDAVILPLSKVTQKDGSYFLDVKGKPAHEIYVSVENDWIEPITPPTMPASLGVAPDAMEIREPQGDVTVALPSAPATFVPATDKMAIPNGAVVKTGANGTAAVLMGGINSVRLIPNSSAAVQQTVTPLLRTTEVDLTSGAVFSKVGKRIGEKQDYQVHTPFGVAAARGTDFVTIAMPARTDVWIAQGTVQMDQPDGKLVGTVSSEGTGALKIIRNPPMPDAHAAMMASSETMTAAMDFIPTVNVYVKALDDKMAQGIKLTATERDYLNRIKKVPCLIKLALVEPPAPPPPPPAPAPAPAAAVPAPATPDAPVVPIEITIVDDGSISVNDAPTGLDALPARLGDIAKANPSQPILIVADDKAPHAQIQKVIKLCHAAKLTHVKRVKTPPPPAPGTMTSPTAESPPVAVPPAPVAPAAPATPPAPVTPTPPPVLTPINLDLRTDAKVDFQGATLSLADLKPKLQALGKATPTQPLVVNGQEKVKPAELKKVLALCKAAKLTKVTVTPAAPLPVPPPAPVATTPAPTPAAPPTPPPVLAPMEVDVRADGKVDFQGATLSLDDLKSKMEEIAKAHTDQPIVVKRKEKLEKGQLKAVAEICRGAKLTKVTVDKTPPPAVVAVPPTPPPPSAPPAVVVPPTPVGPPPKPLPPAMLLPLNLELRPDGKADFQGSTFTLDQLKPMLEDLGKTTPNQPLVVMGREKVTRAEVKKVVALCREANLTKVTVAKAMPSTAPALTNEASGTDSSVASNVDSSQPKVKSVTDASAAPISTGPNYTVP